MTFICRQCGGCCSTMGEIIEIVETEEPLAFRIHYIPTGEERRVTIDPEKKDLFLAQDTVKSRQLACPFLREKSPGVVICTAHNSRPELCRQYACFRILLLDSTGDRIGKVQDGSRVLSTPDGYLRALWNGEVAGLSIADETEWERRVSEILTRAGYTVV
ncbi:MAG: hypothetical protein METHP_01868 [Methanoregula sp. SKADARSKE-2]|nr:MAG: hypothetical protein METHP_01868 [Methanoregula sp. SKADARSKE-2]